MPFIRPTSSCGGGEPTACRPLTLCGRAGYAFGGGCGCSLSFVHTYIRSTFFGGQDILMTRPLHTHAYITRKHIYSFSIIISRRYIIVMTLSHLLYCCPIISNLTDYLCEKYRYPKLSLYSNQYHMYNDMHIYPATCGLFVLPLAGDTAAASSEEGVPLLFLALASIFYFVYSPAVWKVDRCCCARPTSIITPFPPPPHTHTPRP